MKLLIIRPQPGNDASAARARTAGFDPVQLPFFEVRARDWQAVDPGDYDALLITSSNAVRHTGAQLGALSALPVHAVGRVSAEAAIAAGFDIASSGLHGMAEALVAAQAAGHQRLLWLAGEDRIAIETPKAMHIEERIVYASEAVMLSDAAKAVIESCPLARCIPPARRKALPPMWMPMACTVKPLCSPLSHPQLPQQQAKAGAAYRRRRIQRMQHCCLPQPSLLGWARI
jgi:hypothetical protein